MKDVDPAITITCYYPKVPATDTAREVGQGTPVFRNIHISNLTATCPRSAGIIVGLPESAVENLCWRMCISPPRPVFPSGTRGMQLKNVTVDVQRGRPFLVQDAQVEGLPAENR